MTFADWFKKKVVPEKSEQPERPISVAALLIVWRYCSAKRHVVPDPYFERAGWGRN